MMLKALSGKDSAYRKSFLAFSLFLLFNASAFALPSKIDSLIVVLKQSQEDSTKVNLLIKIAWEYHNSKPSETVVYANRALGLAETIKFKKGEANALNLIGIGYSIQGNSDDAMSYYKAALKIAKEIGERSVVNGCMNNIGLIYQQRGEYSIAMDYFHDAMGMLDPEKDKRTVGYVLNNIGAIHSLEQNHEKALEYFEETLSIEREMEDKLGISMALTNIGEQHKLLGKNTKALICYKEGLILSEEIDDKVGEAILLSNIGEIHYENALYDLADEYFPRALETAKSIGDQVTVVKVLNNIAKLRIKKENFNSSISYAQQGLEIARDIGDKEGVKNILGTLSNAYAGKKDFEKALEYKNLFVEARDSIYSTEKSKQIMELATRYDTQKKETENQLLKEQQAKNEAIIEQRTFAGVAGALILLLTLAIASILYYFYRQKKKYSLTLEEKVNNRTNELEDSNSKLRSSNKELERFAYIASHDLKEPLRNIMSFAKLIERKLPKEVKEDKDIKEYMSYIFNNTSQMHRLIQDVLEFSRIDSIEKENTEIIDLRDLVLQVTKVLSSTITERNVDLKVGNLPQVVANRSKLFIVIKNLIENGIKYNTSNAPKIWIQTKVVGQMNQISITDNGIGIDGQFQKRIFGMFKRLHNREKYQGSGLGLSICKKIIENLGGSIRVESQLDKGSKFIFTIPILKNGMAENVLQNHNLEVEQKTMESEFVNQEKSDKMTYIPQSVSESN